MRVIIAGEGESAYQFAKEMADRRDAIVLAEDPETAARFDGLDVQVVLGSPADSKVLHQIDLSEQDNFVACSESDERNIVACLTAKQVCGAHTICFVSKEEYYRSFAPDLDKEPTHFIDRLIWPQYMLAEEISRIVLVPKAIDVEILAGGRIWLQEYRIQEKSAIVGEPLRELNLHPGMLAVSVARGNEFYIPRGGTILKKDDKVTFMGTPRALRSLERHFFRRGIEEKVKYVTIIGGGNVGGILARVLEGATDLQVKIIEKDLERCQQLAVDLKSTLVLNADGTDLELLDLEQIYLSDVLVAVTGDDEKNLLCSLLAREMEIPKIITRVSNAINLHLLESLGIDVPLNPSRTATKTVLASLKETNVHLLALVEQGKGNVVELVVPDEYPPTYIRDLPLIEGAIIATIVRKGQTIVPHGSDKIEAGDNLLVVTTQEASDAVQIFF